MKAKSLTLALCVAVSSLSKAQLLPYQLPPRLLVALADAPPMPRVSFSPDGEWMLEMDVQEMPAVADLSQPELRLVGLRINTVTNSPSRVTYVKALRLRHLPDGKPLLVQGLPANARISNVQWSPDNAKLAFTHTSRTHMELWVMEVAAASARLVPNLYLNGVLGMPYEWVSDSKTIIARAVVGGRGQAPKFEAPKPKPPTAEAPKPKPPTAEAATAGAATAGAATAGAATAGAATAEAPTAEAPTAEAPTAEAPTAEAPTAEVAPKTAPLPPPRTYNYNLKSPADEYLLNYYGLAQVVRVGLDGGRMSPVGQPGLIAQASPSPNGQYVLVRTYLRPFPASVMLNRFPQQVQVLNMEGLIMKEVVALPAVTSLPAGPDAVPAGPREFGWRDDAPNTLFWVAAQDEGNPQNAAPVRDRIFTLPAPFDEPPRELGSLPLRFRRIHWANDQLAVVEGYGWADRKESVWTLDPTARTPLQPLLEWSAQNAYTHPGTLALRRNKQGRSVLLTNAAGNVVYLIGNGASPEGDRPFVDELNIQTKKSQRWWRSEAPYYEMPVAILDPAKRLFVTRRESEKQAPNYYLHNAGSPKVTVLTQFANPYDGLGNPPRKQLLRYQRADGIVMTATIYLPANYKKENGPLPTLLEVYPTEFQDKVMAGHVSGSLESFARYNWVSPLYWVSQGYAVVQNGSMPVFTDVNGQPTSPYAEQLTAAAQAVLTEGNRLGLIDTARVAVLGQGYGAFVTANLLANSRLFKAGIACAGVHNQPPMPVRLLGVEKVSPPAPEAYVPTASFGFADTDTIRTPLLVLPGEADTEPAEFAVQNEQFYEALQRNGANVRYATLPDEAHGYTARESLMQLLWEMNTWLEANVKKPPLMLPTSFKPN